MAPASEGKQGTTLFIVQVELPAFNLLSQVKFNVRASRYEDLHEGTVEMLQGLAESYEDCLDSLDVHGSKYGLERMRKHACIELEELHTQVKLVEEWKQKVDRASAQMNKMRDAYYKELFHLREQVYQKKKADEKQEHFQPNYAIHFDPAEYTMESEVAKLVTEKAEFIKQEYDTKFSEVEAKHQAKVKTLNNQLITANMLLSRKEVLLDKVMSQHGYEDEDHVQEELGTVKVNKEKIQSKINRQCEKAEQKAVYDFRKQSASGGGSGAAGEGAPQGSQHAQHFRQFLERRFGTLKEAKAHLATLRNLDDSVGMVEFKALADQLGYAASDPKQTFKEVSAGQPFTTVALILENIQRADAPALNRGNIRRCTAPCKLGEEMLVSIAESGEWEESEQAANQDDEDKASVVSEGLVSNSSRDSDGSSSSKASKTSKLSKGSKSSIAKALGVANAVKKASSKLRSRIAPAGQVVRRKTEEVMTELSVNAGTEAAWAEEPGSVLCFTRLAPADRLRDMGTDARPYQEAFQRKHLRTRAVQSQIDGRMLDKAMDFYDEVAESNWNELAGIMQYDSEASQPEECKGRGLRRGTSTGQLFELSDQDRQQLSQGRPTESMTISDLHSVQKVLVQRNLGDSSPKRRCTFPMEDGPEQQSLEKVVEEFSTLPTEELVSRLTQDLHGPIGGTEQVGGSSSSRSSSPRSCREEPTRQTQSRAPACSTAECGVQCRMACLGEVEPQDEEEPPEAQLERMQRALDLAQELKDGLPAMRLRAEKLAAEAGPGAEKGQRLLEQLRKLNDKLEGRPPPVQTSRALDAEAEALGGASKAAESLEGLLSRHGLDASGKDQLQPQQREGHSFTESRRLSSGQEAITRKETRHRTTFFRRPSEAARPVRSAGGPAQTNRSELVFSPMGVEAATAANEADDDTQGLKRQRAITARKMSALDTTKMIADRARRHSAEGQLQTADAEAAAPAQQSDNHLSPGWSGLVPPASFASRGVPAEVEADHAPERSAPAASGLSRAGTAVQAEHAERSANRARALSRTGSIQARLASPSSTHGEQESFTRTGKRLATTALCFVGPLAAACAAAAAAVPEDRDRDSSPEPAASPGAAERTPQATSRGEAPRRHSCESYFTSLPPVTVAPPAVAGVSREASGGGREAAGQEARPVMSPPPFQRHQRRASSVRFKPTEESKQTEEVQEAALPAVAPEPEDRPGPTARREADAARPAAASEPEERLVPREPAVKREGPGARSHAGKLQQLPASTDDGYLDTDIEEVIASDEPLSQSLSGHSSAGSDSRRLAGFVSPVPDGQLLLRELSSPSGSQAAHSARAAAPSAAGTGPAEPWQVQRSCSRSATLGAPGGSAHGKVSALSPVTGGRRKVSVQGMVSPTMSMVSPSSSPTRLDAHPAEQVPVANRQCSTSSRGSVATASTWSKDAHPPEQVPVANRQCSTSSRGSVATASTGSKASAGQPAPHLPPAGGEPPAAPAEAARERSGGLAPRAAGAGGARDRLMSPPAADPKDRAKERTSYGSRLPPPGLRPPATRAPRTAR